MKEKDLIAIKNKAIKLYSLLNKKGNPELLNEEDIAACIEKQFGDIKCDASKCIF
jgi:hypothetical protein